MRALSAAQTKLLGLSQASRYFRVRVIDAGSTSHDLSSLRGINWISTIKFGEEIDQNIATASITLSRDVYSLSLAPEMLTSVFNVTNPYLATGNVLYIDEATLPIGTLPQSSDWQPVFHGKIDKPDWGADPLTLTCRDLAGQGLADVQLQYQRDIGVWDPGHTLISGIFATASTAANGSPPFPFYQVTTPGTTQGQFWTAGRTGVVVGDYIQPTSQAQSSSNPPAFLKCTSITTGVTGLSEPNWPTSNGQIYGSGGVIVDGGVTWTEAMGANLWPSTGPGGSPDPLPTTAAIDGTTYAEGGSSTLVWTLRNPPTWTVFKSGGGTAPAGKIITPTANTDEFFIATTGGTAGASEPTWSTALSVGGAVTDGSIVWTFMTNVGGNLLETAMQQILDDANTGVTLTVVPPAGQANTGIYLGTFETSTGQSVMSQLQALATQAGYDLRYVWSGTAGDFELTLSYINRTSPSSVWTFPASSYTDFTDCDTDITPVRTAVQLSYTDTSSSVATNWTNTSTNVPQTKTIVVPPGLTSSYITKYGLRLMEVSMLGCAQLCDSFTATAFANACLTDLEQPYLNITVEMDYFWAVQLNDTVTFAANGRHFDSAQSVAVISIQHECDEDGKATSTFQLRGLPTAGAYKWHAQAGVTGQTKSPRRKPRHPATPIIGLGATVAGFFAFIQPPYRLGDNYDRTEIHSGGGAFFAPNGNTLLGSAKSGRVECHGLIAGATYYIRTMHRDKDGVCSLPSPVRTVVPSYVTAALLSPVMKESFKATTLADVSVTPGIDKGATHTASGALKFYVEAYDSQGAWNGNGSSTGTVWTVINGGSVVYRVRSRVTLWGATPGVPYQLQLMWTHSGTTKAIAVGEWVPAFSDDQGNNVALPQFDETINGLTAGDTLSVMVKSLSNSVVTMKAYALATNGPFTPGSFFEVTEIPNA